MLCAKPAGFYTAGRNLSAKAMAVVRVCHYYTHWHRRAKIICSVQSLYVTILYVSRLTQLRAQVLLERALERTQGAQPVEDFASSIAPDTSLAQLDPDLYRVISSMPLDWSGEQNNNTTLSMMPDVNNLTSMPENVPQTASIQQPGADVSSAIAVDSDDDESLSAPSRRGGETVSNDQPTKRRKVDAAPTQTSAPAAPEDTTDLVSMLLSNELGSLNDTKKKEPTPTDAKDASATNVTDSSGLDQLIADNMSDLSWLDFSSLGNQNSSDNTQLSTLFGESSADTPGANVGGLTSLDFSDQEKMNG